MPAPRRPLLTSEDQAGHHRKMTQPAPASAYDHLVESFESAAYELRSLSGVIEGVAVWDKFQRYLFAWQVNPHHLLFYLRRPALEVQPQLHQSALNGHPQDHINVNRAGETTIRLISLQDAQKLTAWLMPQLPLPVVARQR